MPTPQDAPRRCSHVPPKLLTLRTTINHGQVLAKGWGTLTPGGLRIGLNGAPFTLIIGPHTFPRNRTFR